MRLLNRHIGLYAVYHYFYGNSKYLEYKEHYKLVLNQIIDNKKKLKPVQEYKRYANLAFVKLMYQLKGDNLKNEMPCIAKKLRERKIKKRKAEKWVKIYKGL